MKRLSYILFLLICTNLNAQQSLNLKEAIERSLEQNRGLKIAALELDAQKSLKKTANELPKSVFELQYGRTQVVGLNDFTLGFTQQFSHPKYYKSVANLLQKEVEMVEQNQVIKKNELAFQIKEVFVKYAYYQKLESLLKQQDSLFQVVQKAAKIRYETGESALLEKVESETRTIQNQTQIQLLEKDKLQLVEALKLLLNTQTDYLPNITELKFNNLLNLNELNVLSNPFLELLSKQNDFAKSQIFVEKNRLLPDYKFGFLNQSIEHTWNQFVVQGGIAVPIFAKAQKARIDAYQISQKVVNEKYNLLLSELQTQLKIAYTNYQKNAQLLKYYEETALPQGNLIQNTSLKQYRSGEISYTEYVQASQQAWLIKENYLSKLLEISQLQNEIDYLTGNSIQ